MIGIIAAMEAEINDLITKTQVSKEIKVGNYTFYQGLLDDVEVVILKCGIGKVASSIGACLMIDHFKPSVIINTGIAGGICGVKSKDIVLTKSLSYGDVDCTVFGYTLGQVPQMPAKYEADKVYLTKIEEALQSKGYAYQLGHAFTFDSFITTLKNKNINKEAISICEMEGASLAQTCYLLNTPFVGIRYISDIVDEKGQVDDYQAFELTMAHLSSKIINDIIKFI